MMETSCSETVSPDSVATCGPLGRMKKQAGTIFTMISQQEPRTEMGEGSLKINST